MVTVDGLLPPQSREYTRFWERSLDQRSDRGFHIFDELDLLSGLSLVCPAHCTKKMDRILRRYPGFAVKAGVGRVIEILGLIHVHLFRT